MMNLFKTSSISLLLVLTVSLPGCDGLQNQVLSAEAHKWIPYSEGQPAVTFTNDQNQVRTLEVAYAAEKKEITPKFSVNSYFQDQVQATLTDQNGGGVGVSLMASSGDEVFGIVSGNLQATHLVGSQSLDQRGLNDAFLSTYTSRGKNYQQVVHLKCDTNNCKGSIEEVFYAKTDGLIEVVMKDGQRWYKVQ